MKPSQEVLQQYVPKSFARRLGLGDVVQIIGFPDYRDGKYYVEVRLPADALITYFEDINNLELIEG